jgi:hypothetical protein
VGAFLAEELPDGRLEDGLLLTLQLGALGAAQLALLQLKKVNSQYLFFLFYFFFRWGRGSETPCASPPWPSIFPIILFVSAIC